MQEYIIEEVIYIKASEALCIGSVDATLMACDSDRIIRTQRECSP